MKKYFSFALLAMFLLGCDSPSGYYPSSNKSYVITGEAKDVTYKSVILSGEVNVDIADYETIEWGMMYSTDKDELEGRNGEMVVCDDALIENAYCVDLSGLEAETKYYYCAFVYVNNQDFKFGSIKNFTTLEAPKVDGIGVFSVSESKQVTFAPGNLQYTQSTQKWSFAENQWDYIGTDNVTGGSVYFDPTYGDGKEGTALADKVDLFGFSTSATNYGVSTSTDSEDYYGSFCDWRKNKIGSETPYTWRTLTYEEWDYLRYNRPNADNLVGVAQVKGVNGLVFLPDNWTCPSGVTFKSGFHSSYGVNYYAAYQTFSADQWALLEVAGAVFLPAAGYRLGSNVDEVQGAGGYWSVTDWGGCHFFGSDGAGMGYTDRYYGLSVRLVKDL